MTALRMRFPAGREFTFKVTYGRGTGYDYETIEEVRTDSATGVESFLLLPCLH